MDQEKVTKILQSYRLKKRRIAQLQFELEHPSQITASELLRTIALGSSEFSIVHSSGSASDKTVDIVANYDEITDRLNLETLEQIKRELRVLMNETEKLELYVSLLDTNYERVIRLRDFEGKSWGDMETELDATERRLRDLRKAAIAELSEMYGFVDALKDKNNEEIK